MNSFPSDDTIQEQVNQILGFIHTSWKHYELRQDDALFSQLCSSLDVIEDTEEAITAYRAKEFGDSISAHYLAVYGLLQAIFVQQDAVDNLCEALGIQEGNKKGYENFPVLKKIRDIRNDAVGHPSKRTHTKPVSYHHISQPTLSQAGFTLISYHADGSPSVSGEIDIEELISGQRGCISEILAAVVSNLEAEERAHKEEFRMEKLTRIFPKSLGHHFEKVSEGILRRNHAKRGEANLKRIDEVVRNFREAVGRRDKDFHESLQGEYDLIEYAINSLHQYFQMRVDQEEAEVIETPAAQIFATFLRGQVENLKEYARKIDSEYEG